MKIIENATLRNPSKLGIKPVWDENSKILIVGSMTATDGIKKGFFYASARNQLWQLLDLCLGLEGEKSFSFLKNKLKVNCEDFDLHKMSQLQFENNKGAIRGDISQLLHENNIAMCDIFKECYFNKNSSLDSEIILNNSNYPYQTNKEVLQEIVKKAKVEKVVVTSKFVEEWFKRLDIKGNFELCYVMSPSPRRGAIEKKKESWLEVFK